MVETKVIASKNLPEQLNDLVKRWAENDKSFYLAPENMFIHENQKLKYKNCESISQNIGDWFVHTSDCHTPMKLSADEIDEIQYELIKNCIPELAILAIGFKCNIACHMCAYHGESKKYYEQHFSNKTSETPFELVCSRIDKLKELGVKNLFVGSDGEFLLRKDWEDIYKYAQSVGYKFILCSNGTLIDKNIVKKLKNYGVFSVKISANAINFDTWTKVCGCKSKKLFDNMKKAPELLKNMGIEVSVSFVCTDINKHELPEFIEYWHSKGFPVNIANRIQDEEFYNGNKKLNNSLKPYYMCASLGEALMILPDGVISPCCAVCYQYDDANSKNLPVINLDEDVDVIKEKYSQIMKEKIYNNICRNCVLYSLRSEVSNKFLIYGIEGYVTDYGYTINPKPEKKRKTITQRIKNELKHFKEHTLKII